MSEVLELEETVAKGTKESTELVLAMIELPVDVGLELKDGFQWDDIVRLGQKLATKPVYIEGFKGIGEVIPEVKDLKLDETISFFILVVMNVPRIVSAFKKGELQKMLAQL